MHVRSQEGRVTTPIASKGGIFPKQRLKKISLLKSKTGWLFLVSLGGPFLFFLVSCSLENLGGPFLIFLDLLLLSCFLLFLLFLVFPFLVSVFVVFVCTRLHSSCGFASSHQPIRFPTQNSPTKQVAEFLFRAGYCRAHSVWLCVLPYGLSLLDNNPETSVINPLPLGVTQTIA
ncbi:hypothetical protein CA13_17130 [Planctomycetes bacterium CA13]|uniref:Uncharacterized protein n=1 Tax=Novipirellula herctigrandis TaxID=2527986 RepID=A0A5C5YZD5_9BACT|nr:hypothetical protein CA13_17130 [Planctomycetes bacterium CA13]